MTPFADDPPGFKRYYLNEELIEEKELTQEEIKAIEKKANACIKEAKEKEFCLKAMEIALILTEEDDDEIVSSWLKEKWRSLLVIVPREIKKNNLHIILKFCSIIVTFDDETFETRRIANEVFIYYKDKLVFSGKREYDGYEDIKTYIAGKWEEELFSLHGKLPEYQEEREKQEEQKKVKELKACFGL